MAVCGKKLNGLCFPAASGRQASSLAGQVGIIGIPIVTLAALHPMSNRLHTAAAAALLVFTLFNTQARAQFSPSPEMLEQLSPESRQKALQALQGGGGLETSDGASVGVRLASTAKPLSGGEAQEIYGNGGQLPLFGYALFSGAGNAFVPSAEVPIPENYVLGPGDVIRVQMFGNQNETLNLSVTRDGAVNFPKLGPIQVAGLSVDEARTVIDRRVAKELIGVQTNITLGPLRGIQVFLLGDARQPGAYPVSGLATITNALMAGGGVAPTGSLRRVELKRAGRTVQRIDLYDFLLRGDSSRDVRLQAGDAVFIPPVGPRIAVAGAVTRPAVYEMLGGLTVKAALELAGGLTGNARRAQATLERVDADGQRQLRSLDMRDAGTLGLTLKDGDRLDISALYESAENPVSVLGHVRYEKSFAWSRQLTLSRLLALAEVRPSEPGRELYPVMALIERTDEATGLRSWRGFDLAAVQSGRADEPVQSLDRVIVLTRTDINYLLAPEVRRALSGALPRPIAETAAAEAVGRALNPTARLDEGNDALRSRVGAVGVAKPGGSGDFCPALLEVVKISDSSRAISIRVLLEAQATEAESRFGQASLAAVSCPAVFRAAPTALTYLLEHSAGLTGEVRLPGLYPFVKGISLERLTAIAGGETPEADRAEVEFFDISETPRGGSPRFRKLKRNTALVAEPVAKAIYKFLPASALPQVGTVNVTGEVRFPGHYVFARGERYSDVLARAGGLNETAFAYGTVFTRNSAKAMETVANRRAAADLRESLVTSATNGYSQQSGTANAAVLELVQKLESAPAVGRVVIEADPAVLASRPGADFLLEPGDEIFVPKRPYSVAVTGQVLSPGSLTFVSGANPRDYIRQAGGYAQSADTSRAFLVLPNGAARPLRSSFWQYQQESIPPGSVIVVPRDVSPFKSLLLTERITGILSNLALSAAALVSISR